jgi:hypothetical protein
LLIDHNDLGYDIYLMIEQIKGLLNDTRVAVLRECSVLGSLGKISTY